MITVIDIDTGALASETILPGVIEPKATMLNGEDGPCWVLPLAPVVDRLVTKIGGSLLESHFTARILSKPLALPREWHPDLPAPERLRLEAVALARAQGTTRHRHFFTSTVVAQLHGPDHQLALLTALADRMHLDLCCYRYATISDELDRPTQRGWYIAFELPAPEVPATRSSSVHHCSLADALAETDPITLLKRLQFKKELTNPLPAKFIEDTVALAGAAPLGINIEILENELNRLTGDLNGAVAVRRNGAWHYAMLQPTDVLDDFKETSTGQVRHRRLRRWRRTPVPPPPTWWGDQIPELPCPQCETGTTWVPCDCIQVLTEAPDPLCERCSGTGSRKGTHCSWCGQIGSIRYGYSVTVAGMEADAAVHHFNFDLGTDAEHQLSASPQLAEMVRTQLPEAARLTTRLFAKGIDLADLRETTGLPPSASILDAGVSAPEGTPMVDLVHRHASSVAAGRPGARVFLIWAPPSRATVLQLTRIAWGLGLDLVIGAEDRNDDVLAGTALGGMRWGAALLHPGEEPDRNLTGAFGKRRLAVAVQACIDHLPHRLNIATDEKPGPLEVVPAPQQTNPPVIDGIGDLEPVLSSLASRFRGLVSPSIVVRLSPKQVTFTRLTAGAEHRQQPVVPMASAPTLVEALAQLGRPEVG